jgi:hypothetical protein
MRSFCTGQEKAQKDQGAGFGAKLLISAPPTPVNKALDGIITLSYDTACSICTARCVKEKGNE